jgi:hypothetical protein
LQQGDLNIRRPDGGRLANQQGNDEDQKQLGPSMRLRLRTDCLPANLGETRCGISVP